MKRKTEHEEWFDREPRTRHRTRHDGRPGEPGSDGQPVKSEPNTATAGEERTATVEGTVDEIELFASQLTPLMARLTLRSASIHHINQRIDEALADLQWLAALLGPTLLRSDDQGMFDQSPEPDPPAIADDQFDHFRKQVVAQIRRLSMGLDVYGNSLNFVPMLTVKPYSDYIERWLPGASEAEARHRVYSDDNASQQRQMQAVETALDELDGLISQLKVQIQETDERRDKLNDEVSMLLEPLEAAGADLLLATETFQRAISQQADGCSFGDLVKGVGAIVGIAKGGVGAYNAVGALATALDSDEQDLTKYIRTIAGKVKAVGGQLSSLHDAYTDLRSSLARSDTAVLPTDLAKIVAQRSELEKTIAPFRSIASAEGYLQQVDRFIELAMARNNKIFEHDMLALQIAESESQIDQAEVDTVRLRDDLSRTGNPRLPQLVEFMARMVDAYKTELVRALYYEQRALAYLTLVDMPELISRSTVEHLKNIHFQLQKQMQRAQEDLGRDHQTLDLGHAFARFKMSALVGTEGMSKLKMRKHVYFTIPEEEFSDFFHVYVTKVRASVTGLAEDEIAAIRLVHMGQARFEDRKSERFEFVHAPRVTLLTSDDDNGSSLGQSETFISLTPFGPWRIDLNLGRNRRLSFDGLDDLTLEFEVKFLARL